MENKELELSTNDKEQLRLDPSMVDELGMALVRTNNPRDLFGHEQKTSFFKKDLPEMCATLGLVVCFVFFALSLLALAVHSGPPTISTVLVDTKSPSPFQTDPKYASVGLDSSVIADGFHTFNLKSPKLLRLMSYLGPSYLRIGGTMADRLYFVPDGNVSFKTSPIKTIDGGEYAYEGKNAEPLTFPNFTMSGKEFLELNLLASQAGMTVIFDLNCLIRFPNGSWNSKNAEELIGFSQRHNLNVMWELGNEPNSFRHVFNYEVKAEQLAKDFIQLRNILNKYPLYKNSMIIGPDITRPRNNHQQSEKYLREFLDNVNHKIDAITWHQYYLNGRTAQSSDFLNPDVFNWLQTQISKIQEVVQAAKYTDVPLWLGETASTYGGGAPGYASRFISTFIWLDKLGMAAKNGISVVVRQSIFKGYYALIGDTFEPTPDWWLTLMYKRLVGPKVVPCFVSANPKVRFYCHCAKEEVMDVMFGKGKKYGSSSKYTDRYNYDKRRKGNNGYNSSDEYHVVKDQDKDKFENDMKNGIIENGIKKRVIKNNNTKGVDGNNVVVFGMNMQEVEAKVRIEGFHSGLDDRLPTVMAYILTSQSTILSRWEVFTRNIVLNDELLYIKNDGDLPSFKPVVISNVPNVKMPPFSLGFFVIPNARANACAKRKF